MRWVVGIALAWPALVAAAEKGTSFDNIREPDWTVNFFLYVLLAALVVGVWFWRTRAFEGAVRAACEGKPVSLRAAYNQFWVWLVLAFVLALGTGVAASFFNVKALLIS